MKGRNPTKREKEWISAVCNIGCIVCAVCEDCPDVPCSPHHINGRTKTGSHLEVIGLCHAHHQADDNNPSYDSVHGSKYRFEKRYGTQKKLLEITKKIIGWDG